MKPSEATAYFDTVFAAYRDFKATTSVVADRAATLADEAKAARLVANNERLMAETMEFATRYAFLNLPPLAASAFMRETERRRDVILAGLDPDTCKDVPTP